MSFTNAPVDKALASLNEDPPTIQNDELNHTCEVPLKRRIRECRFPGLKFGPEIINGLCGTYPPSREINMLS